jgi:hypothetical protein
MSDGPWKVRIAGIVSRWVEGARYPVTEDVWKMRKLEGDKFQFDRTGEEPFELSGKEVRTYVYARTLVIEEGQWP